MKPVARLGKAGIPNKNEYGNDYEKDYSSFPIFRLPLTPFGVKQSETHESEDEREGDPRVTQKAATLLDDRGRARDGIEGKRCKAREPKISPRAKLSGRERSPAREPGRPAFEHDQIEHGHRPNLCGKGQP